MQPVDGLVIGENGSLDPGEAIAVGLSQGEEADPVRAPRSSSAGPRGPALSPSSTASETPQVLGSWFSGGSGSSSAPSDMARPGIGSESSASTLCPRLGAAVRRSRDHRLARAPLAGDGDPERVLGGQRVVRADRERRARGGDPAISSDLFKLSVSRSSSASATLSRAWRDAPSTSSARRSASLTSFTSLLVDQPGGLLE